MKDKPANQRTNKVPVSVIAGFLGSGKTTLLNRLIQHPGMSDAALIVNEFGEIGIDHALVDSALENTVVMDSGCLCCTIRGDLIDTISELFAKVEAGDLPRFSKILIEPTGLADPGPIIHALDQMDAMGHPCTRDAIVTMIDGQQGARQLDEHEEAARQIAVADVAILTKTDLIDDDAAQSLMQRIDGLNPGVPVRTAVHGEIDPSELFLLASRSAAIVPDPAASDQHREHTHNHVLGDDHHRHDAIQAHAISTAQKLGWERLRTFLETMFSLRGDAFLRVKGIVWLEGADDPVLIQGVGNAFSPPKRLDRDSGGEGLSRLVFIHNGLNGDAIEQTFRAMVLDGAIPEGRTQPGKGM